MFESERIGVGTVELELERSTKGSFSFQFETFSQMESALELIFSPSAASVILYVAAVKCGAHSYRRMMKRASTKEEILNHLSELKNDENWGKISLNHLSELKNDENWGKISFLDVDFVNGSGRVIIVDSFESIARKTTQPCCHFFRGFLAGFLSELFEKTIEITEEKCVGKGDGHCEFVFG